QPAGTSLPPAKVGLPGAAARPPMGDAAADPALSSLPGDGRRIQEVRPLATKHAHSNYPLEGYWVERPLVLVVEGRTVIRPLLCVGKAVNRRLFMPTRSDSSTTAKSSANSFTVLTNRFRAGPGYGFKLTNSK